MKTIYQKSMNSILVTGFLFLFLLPACSRNREEKEQKPPVFKQERREKEPAETGKKEPREEIGGGNFEGIGPIDTLTPELFVQITIQYRKAHKKWLEEAQELPPNNRSAFIEKANRTFFERIGITEGEYIAYSQNNIDALNAYIEEHPQLLPDVMDY